MESNSEYHKLTGTPALRTSYAVVDKVDAVYTGGKVQVTSGGDAVFCTCGDSVNVLNTSTGRNAFSYKHENDDVSSFACSPDGKLLVVACRSLLLYQWSKLENAITRQWKAAHKSSILHMEFDGSSTLLATGSSDGTVKVYDVHKLYYTHNLKGCQGVISFIKFHPDPIKLHIFASSDDGKLRMWDLNTSRCAAVFDGHYSAVISIAFSFDHSCMISAGRDRVFILWDLLSRKQIRIVPTYENLECIAVVPSGFLGENNEVDPNAEHVVTAGEFGYLRVWSLESGKCVYPVASNQNETVNGQDQQVSPAQKAHLAGSLSHLEYCPEKCSLYGATFDHNIVIYRAGSVTPDKQFVGYYDEVIDARFCGEAEEHVAVASNGNDVKVLHYPTMSCQLMTGHTGTVMALDVSFDGRFIVSASKDNTIRVWRQNTETGSFVCVAVGSRHTQSVEAISWSKGSNSFIVSGSPDTTIKYWTLPNLLPLDLCAELTAKWTQKAHDKDVNCVSVSPNDKLVASASQDKTVKVWRSKKGNLVGVLQGHKRGVWCVAFSPVDRCVASCSSDSTIKLWALDDFTCVKSFEGHTGSVLKMSFLNRGMQIISSGSDGLIKLWTVNTGECLKTFDQHEDKVWALACQKTGEMIVSGGADAVINIWKDVTQQEMDEQRKLEEGNVLREQELANYMQQKDYNKAISLAITLGQPFRVLSMLKNMLRNREGTDGMKNALTSLRPEQLGQLLKFLCDWNTNTKHSFVSQTVLSVLLKMKGADNWLSDPDTKGIWEGLIPYTDRHLQRMNRLLQQSTFVDFTWQSMKLNDVPRSQLLGADSVDEELAQLEEVVDVTTALSAATKAFQPQNGSSGDESDQLPIDNSDKSVVERASALKQMKGTKHLLS